MGERVEVGAGIGVLARDEGIASPRNLPTLRFLTCGSVDDGKSTLIGRLLYDQQLILDDQLAALERDSKKHGTVGKDIDFALLVDGLEAEREQGITIDVAYRAFSTARRSFIVADTPGHEQYTRNMATGASNCDLAILLVDARKGLLAQTHRHAAIVSLLGIRHVVLAVNKFDLVDYDQAVFDKIVAEFGVFAAKLGFVTLQPIPISARFGENISDKSDRTPWYLGPPLIDYLETIEVEEDLSGRPFRMPVQAVNRPHLDFRGFCGTIASGTIRPGDPVTVAVSGRASHVARIVTADGDLPSAGAGDAVTLTLADEIDVGRGDILVTPQARPEVVDQFAATLIWMSDETLLPGRSYLMKIGTRSLPVSVTSVKYRLDVTSLGELPAKSLALNEVGCCNLAATAPIALDPYKENRTTGAFILIDRYTNATVAAGLIAYGLRRATNVHVQDLTITREARARLKHQTPTVLWFTGLSGSGKSTIANLLETQLHSRGVHTILLDGDNIRHGLNKDLSFTEADRVENIRRIGEVAKLMTDAGLIVLCAFISPFAADRRMVRELVHEGEFVEIFVDTPLEDCIARDSKGLYKKALAGEIKNFTGIDQVYEPPEKPELILGRGATPAQSAAQVITYLLAHQHIERFDDSGDWSI
ncbi:adenylyl-sulfate kinase [Methylovirgula ligni]|uniref:Multifunctional fusion protein n=1 Tax=Methylovirgula ligni TaxID=569860 RepID=A0A3D9Z2A1_9HYPH|nr:sulfate adenylyltransferase subunit CysN [Methylovirgula ligni]QAY95387.1 adenylyl-sulfate kinase [Methylovirgula ligni]REF89292.1 adenylylsulfate kinase /sulfate adenylyltransferase subunit 1 [Methylovirgula ligni]